MKHSIYAGLLASIATIMPFQAVRAQQSESASGQPGEIIVTATRRAERLQDVPVAVTAITADEVVRSSFRNLTDIQYLAPSVQINMSQNYPTYNIRGVGTQTWDAGAEGSVSLVVDGVVEGNLRSLAINGLGDIERVEVLRGPQGTLFGKNASAGVIQIITKAPEFDSFSMSGRLNYGSQNEIVSSLTANVPISETLAVRATAYYQDRDGTIRNFDGVRLGDNRDFGVRGRLRWQPSPAFRVDLIGYASRNDNTTGFPTLRQYGALTNVLTRPLNIPVGPRNETAVLVGDKYVRGDNSGASMELSYDLGGLTLTSITAWKGWSARSNQPVGQVPVGFADVNRGEGYHTDQYTQEFRLASGPGPFTYQAGLYFYNYDFKATQLQGGSLGLNPPAGFRYSPGGGRLHFHNRNKSSAAFVDGTWNVTERLRILAGARYTRDSVFASLFVTPEAGILPLGPVAPPFDGEIKHDNISGRAGVQYNFTPDIMAYATASSGYKGPVAASLGNGAVNNVRPETVRAYEAGLKSVLFDRRLMLNLAVFTAKYKDFQATVFDQSVTPAISRLANAESLISRGIEVDYRLQVSNSLSFSGNVALNDTKYGKLFTTCYPGQPRGTDALTSCAPVPGSATATWTSPEGRPLAMTPKWSYTIAADYRHGLGGGLDLDANVRYSWRDKVRSNAVDPSTEINSYGLLNANIGIGPESGAWRVGVYARNLLKQHFVLHIAPSVFDPGGYQQIPSPDANRTFGVTLTFNTK